MKNPYDVIKKPVLTEKSYDMMAEGKYTFIVEKSSTKVDIKKAVEKAFGVTVAKVYTMNRIGKMKRLGYHVGRRPATKKAIIKLAEGSKSIEFFEGMA